MSISISFPSSSFRGLIVTATAFGAGDEEKFRFDWILQQDRCAFLKRRYKGRFVLLSFKNGSRNSGKGSGSWRLLFMKFRLISERDAFDTLVHPALSTARRRSGMVHFAAAIALQLCIRFLLTKAKRASKVP